MARARKASPTPDPLWYKDAVIYQVHVKSFFDSNNDGVGDLAGLTQKLDYIAELGVNTIWVLPFYPSPRRDDGYDISNYRGIHPEYGTLADMRVFLAAAHARGIRVITELVINHTSDQHPWFQRARRARPGSVARNFYVWSDDDRKYAEARIIFVDTEKSNWSPDQVAGCYYWHRFYAHQPDLNFDNERVVKAVLGIMRFWLDVGVDGFRLDAVPYLVEREGTNCENLPETHAILKRIRAELDARAPGCMLLAEANQWPEDVQEYFGAGDECHMAFHFPLMPRMYMAVAQEDRFPISDIMRQTPEIPENCQWAIFLRNHDELTLEMVTDEERDYLWTTYAADRRARLNLGIRRRLAPLLEHDRQRIELLNGLLFSMPGTPVIYYGDEIGMGDNIHLGDRDGVRTPMQWSPDRNGGFSRADPAGLVLPPIMDAIYGFAAVNVEAQAADHHSLLSWTRRMLATRRRHRAFGRGRLRFLYPGNRKILAFLREYDGSESEGEVVLCVANLAHTAEAVELDLSAFNGRVPVDLLGGSTFPPIGELSYLLTLPPYAFYWFGLMKDTAMPAWRIPPSEPLPELVTLVLRSGISDILSSDCRRMIESEILGPYLSRRRWFGAKDQKIRNVRIVRSDTIRGEAGDFVAFEVAVDVGGRSESYFLPVGIVWDGDAAGALAKQLALARVRRHRRTGLLTDAFAVDALVAVVLASLKAARVVPLNDGALQALPTHEEIPIPGPGVEIRHLSAEQSNTSLIIGDLAILKIIRRVQTGIHPQAEMMRTLTERGFANIPALLGEVVRTDAQGMRRTLILVERFVRNQGDGWEWTREALKRVIHAVTLESSDGEGGADALNFYLPFAEAVGKRLGELHAVLAAPCDDPAFEPERVDAKVARNWAEMTVAEVERAYGTLAESRLSGEAAVANVLPRLRPALEDLIEKLAEGGIGSLRTRIHGDLHLGQVLVAGGDAILIDFEGEPAKPLAERRRKGSPFVDVAGMLRSFAYAAGSVAREPLPAAHTRGRRVALLDRFINSASSAFLDAYYAAAAATPHRWFDDRETSVRLIDLFLIRKVAYEISYEAANRPDWLEIPLNDFIAIAERLVTPPPETANA